MNEAVNISRDEDKTSTQLEWIFPKLELPMSRGFGSFACYRVVLAEEVKHGRGAKAYSLVGLAFVVNKKREVDLGVVAKLPRISDVAQPDRSQSGAFCFERFLMFAQLRDVLAAEDSPVVPKEDNHGWPLRPQAAQSHWIAIDVRKGDAGQLAAVSVRHGSHSRSGRTVVSSCDLKR